MTGPSLSTFDRKVAVLALAVTDARFEIIPGCLSDLEKTFPSDFTLTRNAQFAAFKKVSDSFHAALPESLSEFAAKVRIKAFGRVAQWFVEKELDDRESRQTTSEAVSLLLRFFEDANCAKYGPAKLTPDLMLRLKILSSSRLALSKAFRDADRDAIRDTVLSSRYLFVSDQQLTTQEAVERVVDCFFGPYGVERPLIELSLKPDLPPNSFQATFDHDQYTLNLVTPKKFRWEENLLFEERIAELYVSLMEPARRAVFSALAAHERSRRGVDSVLMPATPQRNAQQFDMLAEDIRKLSLADFVLSAPSPYILGSSFVQHVVSDTKNNLARKCFSDGTTYFLRKCFGKRLVKRFEKRSEHTVKEIASLYQQGELSAIRSRLGKAEELREQEGREPGQEPQHARRRRSNDAFSLAVLAASLDPTEPQFTTLLRRVDEKLGGPCPGSVGVVQLHSRLVEISPAVSPKNRHIRCFMNF